MYKNNRRKKGFTLLEVIVVIIIIGVLASLALPRFFSTVEYSKGTEALQSMVSIRQSMERCYMNANGTYVPCTLAALDIEDPSARADTHFDYTLSNVVNTAFTLTATRNGFAGGDSSSTIVLTVTPNGSTRTGTSKFLAIK